MRAKGAEELFHEARGLATRAERDAYLKGACGNDAALRAKVDALLAADAEAGSFLAEPATGAGASVGQQIGRYKLLQPLGEGGFGTVFLAEQREPVKRRVALKIIKLGMDTKQVIARFEAERQALAMMDHPNIAKVLDAGATDTGRPYFVMELVKGVPILEYCDREKLDTGARLELFVAVCHAIQHAHQKGIIHRDIKPSNVLIMLHDGVPVPKVIDFGIAKATSSELTEKTLFTEFGQIIGTPAYMSPEQAGMSGLDIDTRTDIYSLGVLLYEMLTGTTPLDIKSLLESGYMEMMRAIREDEPQRPSKRISSLGATATTTAQQRRTDSKKLLHLLRGDLDWIVMKCLEKDRTRRYETANGLAADIGRHLKDEPIAAGPPSRRYRFRKFVRRNRPQVVAATVVLLALVAAAVGTSWGLVETSRARSTRLARQLEDQRRAATDAARLSRNAAAVGALLDQCEDALRARDAGKAKVALDAARKRTAEGGAEKERKRMRRLVSDLNLLRDLQEVDQFRWSWGENHFPDAAAVATRTRAALARFGVGPDAVSVNETAARVNASAIRERIVAALDRELRHKDGAWARAVLRKVDPDPYRNAVRDAILADDHAKVVALANQDQVSQQPPEFAVCLGTDPTIEPARRRELLLRTVTRWPGDVDLLMALGSVSYFCPTDPKQSAFERIRWFQAAIAADGNNAVAENDLGGALSETGRRDEAIRCFKKAIALDPTMGVAHCNLGNVLRREGNLDAAIASYRKAVELSPNSAMLHCNLGRALGEKGELEEAIICFRLAIVCARSSPVDAYGGLGTALLQAGRSDEGLAALRTAVALDPKNFSSQYNLGLGLRAAGQVDAAITCFRKAVEIDPRSSASYDDLGAALLAKGEADAAIASLRKALEIDPKLSIARVRLGCVLANKGREDEAQACFEKTIELDPTNVPALYNVACCLLQSAEGRGAHPAPHDPEKRARLCRRALDLLHKALALYTERVETGTPADRAEVRNVVPQWLQDPDTAAPARLPKKVREAFGKFRADAAAILKKAESLAPRAPASPNPQATSADEAARVVSILEKTLDRQKAEHGADNPDTVQTQLNLARAYQRAGETDRAVRLWEKGLSFLTARIGRKAPSTLGVMHDLAVAYWSRGELDKSIPLFEEILKRREVAFGRESPDTLGAVANLGVNYLDAGRLEEALPLLEEAMRAAGKHPQLRWVVNPLFRALLKIDQRVAAKHWQLLIPYLKAQFGADHPATLTAMNNLGYSLLRSRQFSDAEKQLKETIAREVRVLGEGNRSLLQTRTNLGELYELQRRNAEAEPLLRRCLAEREKVDPKSFGVAAIESMLGRVLANEKKFAGAESLLLAGLKGLKAAADATPDWGRYYLPDTLDWLVQLYEAWGKPDEAAKWRSERDALRARSGK